MAKEIDKEIQAHRKTLLSVFEMRTDSAHAQAIIWAIEHIRQIELENENLAKTILAISNSPSVTSKEPDEEIHQRRRRERLLDEVTLICVRDRIERMAMDEKSERNWGKINRDTAYNICDGINDDDAAH
jgi:hypothetical protein